MLHVLLQNITFQNIVCNMMCTLCVVYECMHAQDWVPFSIVAAKTLFRCNSFSSPQDLGGVMF